MVLRPSRRPLPRHPARGAWGTPLVPRGAKLLLCVTRLGRREPQSLHLIWGRPRTPHRAEQRAARDTDCVSPSPSNRDLPCGAARRSSAPSSPGRPGTCLEVLLRWPRGTAPPSRSAARAPGAAPAGARRAGRRATPASARRRWRRKRARSDAPRPTRCRICTPAMAVEPPGPGGAAGRSPPRAWPADDRDRGRSYRLHRRERRRQLPLAAVDDDEVRRVGEALVVVLGGHVCEPGEPARDDLPHRREVVRPVSARSPNLR